MKHSLIALLLIGLLPALQPRLAAAETLPGCHILMTEAECGEHLNQLVILAPGTALDQYLAEHLRTKREREAACACSNMMAQSEMVPLQPERRVSLALNPSYGVR